MKYLALYGMIILVLFSYNDEAGRPMVHRGAGYFTSVFQVAHAFYLALCVENTEGNGFWPFSHLRSTRKKRVFN